jgi:hypothetical protein
MQLVKTFAVVASCAAVATAHPMKKTCTARFGADSLGVPQKDVAFIAMGGTWAVSADLPADVLTLDGGQVIVKAPTGSYGFFAISNGALLDSNSTSACNTLCDRLVCHQGTTAVEVSITDTNVTTCGNVTVVIAYANSKTSGNTLHFVELDVCDPDSITLAIDDEEAPEEEAEEETTEALGAGGLDGASPLACVAAASIVAAAAALVAK